MITSAITTNILRPVFRNIWRSVFTTIYDTTRDQEYLGMRLNGVDEYGYFGGRLINIDDDIDIEWYQKDMTNTMDGCIIASQTALSSPTNSEFLLKWDGFLGFPGGELQMYVGGTNVIPTGISHADGRWRVTLEGSDLTVKHNDTVVSTATVTRGTMKEPSATTYFCSRPGGYDCFKGIMVDYRINDHYFSLANYNNKIHIASFDELGDELVPASDNFVVVGSDWTKNSNNDYTLYTANTISYLDTQAYPAKGLVEFDIVSNSYGTDLRVTDYNWVQGDTTASSMTFSQKGHHRYFYVDDHSGTAYAKFRAMFASVTQINIANVSIRSLKDQIPLSLLNIDKSNWETIPAGLRRPFEGLGNLRCTDTTAIATNDNFIVNTL